MKLQILPIVLLSISLAACAPSTMVRTYVDSSLTKASLTAGGITILPLLLSSNVKDANVPEIRRELSRRTSDSVKRIFPSANLVDSEKTLDIIQKNNYLEDFTATSVSFDATGSLRSDVLSKISDISKTRYVLLPYLQTAYSTTTSNGIYSTTTFVSSFSLVIWDKMQQKSVYEGTGKGTAISGLFANKNILDAAYAAFDDAGSKINADIQ